MDRVLPKKQASLFRELPLLLKKAATTLGHNDPLRMAGATAFFTSFALPFILILLTQFLGLLVNPRAIRREIFTDLSDVFGRESVEQIVDTLIAFRQLAQNLWITVFGFLFLLMVATTLLMVIKGSINQIWRIKREAGRSVGKKLRTRLQSVLIILCTGLLIIISIIAETARAHMGTSISKLSPTLAFYVNGLLTHVFSLIFVTLWFAIIFRLLPDARPAWKVTFTGAVVTALLFTLGKYILRLLLINSNLGTLYGTSASVVLILLFVFYSSLILYFGAAFTRVWADAHGHPIQPLSYATRYKVEEVDDH